MYENYTAPLGIGFICDSNHYDPNPKQRAKLTNTTAQHIGYERGVMDGFGGTYNPRVAAQVCDVHTTPEELLLASKSHTLNHRVPVQHAAQKRNLRCVLHPSTPRYWVQNTPRIQNNRSLNPISFMIDFDFQTFHNVPYTHQLHGHGNMTVIQYIYESHRSGAAAAAAYQDVWQSLAGLIDEGVYGAGVHATVAQRLQFGASEANRFAGIMIDYYQKLTGIPPNEH